MPLEKIKRLCDEAIQNSQAQKPQDAETEEEEKKEEEEDKEKEEEDSDFSISDLSLNKKEMKAIEKEVEKFEEKTRKWNKFYVCLDHSELDPNWRCLYISSKLDTLNKHEEAVHENVVFSCNFCKKRLKRQSMNIHAKECHKDQAHHIWLPPKTKSDKIQIMDRESALKAHRRFLAQKIVFEKEEKTVVKPPPKIINVRFRLKKTEHKKRKREEDETEEEKEKPEKNKAEAPLKKKKKTKE